MRFDISRVCTSRASSVIRVVNAMYYVISDDNDTLTAYPVHGVSIEVSRSLIYDDKVWVVFGKEKNALTLEVKVAPNVPLSDVMTATLNAVRSVVCDITDVELTRRIQSRTRMIEVR